MSRTRFTARNFPNLGQTKVVSVRVPASVLERFERAAEAAEGIETRTDALQDAMVVWTLLEEQEAAG